MYFLLVLSQIIPISVLFVTLLLIAFEWLLSGVYTGVSLKTIGVGEPFLTSGPEINQRLAFHIMIGHPSPQTDVRLFSCMCAPMFHNILL